MAEASVKPNQTVAAYGHSIVIGGEESLIGIHYTPQGAIVKAKVSGPPVDGEVHLTIPTPPNLTNELYLERDEAGIVPKPDPGVVTNTIFIDGKPARRGTRLVPGNGIGVTLNLRFPVGPVPREILITSVSVPFGSVGPA